VAISDEETDYLLNVVNAHFKQQIQRSDILHTYAGVRPLCDDESDDPSAVTRDYTLSLSGHPGEAPLLSVFGGKLTTYRKLAESALAQLAHVFPRMGPSWTASSLLPGAEQLDSRSALAEALCARFGWLPTTLAQRWASSYGSRSWVMLKGVNSLSDLGEHLGGGLYTREADYLCQEEWAMQAEDILWRRSKLGLFMTTAQQAKLDSYLRIESPRSPEDAHAA